MSDRADVEIERGGARVLQFACLHDNYGFLLRCAATGVTACIDAPDADEIARRVDAWGGGGEGDAGKGRLDLILNTHWHPDHTGGNEALAARYGALVVGPADEGDRIPGRGRAVAHGDEVEIGDLRARVLATPGHTRGHIVFHLPGPALAFVGDTVFSLGCGRLFEGSADEMWTSLKRLRDLPGETTLFCAHEYTQANAGFALSVEPDNQGLRARADEVAALRDRGQPSVPMRLSDEVRLNPFLRADDPVLAAAVGMVGAAPPAVFAEIRGRKDRF